MKIETKYEFGQIVYLSTDPEQNGRMVCGFTVTPGDILYKLCLGTSVSDHYDFEITEEKDILKKVE